MKAKSLHVIIQLLVIFLVIQFSVNLNNLYAGDRKNIVLVLDTSLSMVGYGGKNILDDVKKSISKYIDQIQEGDRVTFITFDTDARIYPTVYVDDDNDRDILKKYISMTEATGKWTHTSLMIKKVFERAQKIASEKKGWQTIIVIMTDAIDDPPPGKRKDRLDVSSVANKMDLWVYLVSFNDLQKNSKIVDFQKKLESQAGKGGKVKIVQAAKDPKKFIEKDLSQDIKKLESEKKGYVFPLIIALIVIAIVIALLYIIKKFSELKVSGSLEYWNNEVINPYLENYDLAKRGVREVIIGKGVGCHLNIRDIDIQSPFHIKAVRDNKRVRLSISSGGEGYNIEFINKEGNNFVENGDIFKVKNYTFKYIGS